jgi:hypothetical protein
MKMWRPTSWQWIAIWLIYFVVGVWTVLYAQTDSPMRRLWFIGFMGLAAALKLWDRMASRN